MSSFSVLRTVPFLLTDLKNRSWREISSCCCRILTYCADVSNWAALVLVPRMLRNVIKLEAWPHARQSCELWLGLGLRKKIGNIPGWKMQTAYVQLWCCVFFLNWGKWNWSQESKIVLITDSGCDVHSICLPLASPPLRGLLYCRAFFFRLESSLSRKLVTLNGLFADFFTYLWAVNKGYGLVQQIKSWVSRCKHCSWRGDVGLSRERVKVLPRFLCIWGVV